MSYLKLAEHYEECYKKHGDNHLGLDWPNKEDTLKRHKVMLELTKRDNDGPCTLLDFGCGTSAFYEYILSEGHSTKIKYSGLDINLSLLEKAQEKFPNTTFYHMDILKVQNIPNFDYMICNGVFTEKRDLTQEEMFIFFSEVIKKLWNKTNKGIAFNLMSKQVDWERKDLFHVSLDKLGWFLKENLTRSFLIRNDYGLYEYTTYVYK